MLHIVAVMSSFDVQNELKIHYSSESVSWPGLMSIFDSWSTPPLSLYDTLPPFKTQSEAILVFHILPFSNRQVEIF